MIGGKYRDAPSFSRSRRVAFLRERLIQDSATGKLATDGTWEYKIPCFQDQGGPMLSRAMLHVGVFASWFDVLCRDCTCHVDLGVNFE